MILPSQFGFIVPAPTGGDAAITTAFIARTTALGAPYLQATKDFINGLVTDAVGGITSGSWGVFDLLYLLGTQDTTNALLNLPSATYNATANGSPSFSAGAGYTGTDNSSTKYLDTGFNPSTAGGSFGANSCHVSAWGNTSNISSTGDAIIGVSSGGSNNQTTILFNVVANTIYRPNVSSGGGVVSLTSGTHYFSLANRTGASAIAGYRNGSADGTGTDSVGTLPNANIYLLALNSGGSAAFGSGNQLSMASAGGQLSATDITNLYNRLRTFGTAVGWN